MTALGVATLGIPAGGGRVLGRERTQRSQVVMQADVVALLGLLPEEFEGGSKSLNFDYYEARCSHGSSLSRAMHGIVAARLGHAEKALAYFGQTSEIDLADTHVAIAGGIHIAALGGLWQIAVLGFAGLSWTEQGLTIDPKLPKSWTSMRFSISWHGRRIAFAIEGDDIEASRESGVPMTMILKGVAHDLRTDGCLRRPP